jgi:hypothetical protein
MNNSHDPQIKAVIDELLLAIPGVEGGKAFGYPAYKINGKVFLFVGGPGIAIKLPVDRVAALIDSGPEFHAFEPVEGTVWREWVSIDLDAADAYRQHEGLFLESLDFVAS